MSVQFYLGVCNSAFLPYIWSKSLDIQGNLFGSSCSNVANIRDRAKSVESAFKQWISDKRSLVQMSFSFSFARNIVDFSFI